MDTLSMVSEYLKDIEECMDDGDSLVAKEMNLFDALEHKSVVIEVGNQKFAIVTKAPLQAFGEASIRKMVNDVNIEIHRVKFKAHFVVFDYANEGEPSIMFGRDFLETTKSQVDFGLGEVSMNLTMFEEVNSVIDLLEEVGSSSEEVVKMGKANRNKGYKELKESKPILGVLENYVLYENKLDEMLMGKEGLTREDDWLGNFEVGRDEDGNAKYGLVAPSFLDIKDDMERMLEMEGIGPMKDMEHTRSLMAMEIGMLDFRVNSSGYAVGGSSRGARFADEDMDE
nr:hypothetical protein [Tanacetum cinerariifolium]